VIYLMGAGVLVLLLAALWIFEAIQEARTEIADSPRTEMITCDKHGLIPKRYTMHLEGVTEQPIEVCPLCFEDRIKEARAKLKK
jgi:hypothetical protein